MKQFYTILMCGVMGLFLLSGCDSSDKAALEAAKENQLVQKQERDARMAEWKKEIRSEGIREGSYNHFCGYYVAQGYRFNPNDDVEKHCIGWDSEAKEKEYQQKQNAALREAVKNNAWKKHLTPEKTQNK